MLNPDIDYSGCKNCEFFRPHDVDRTCIAKICPRVETTDYYNDEV